MRVYKAPARYVWDESDVLLFLAGSIEMGKADNWQSRITRKLEDERDLVILNPRRDDWDSSWEQSIKNPQFKEQVEWELDGLELADTIILYFDPNTKSPISLLELGLHAREDKMIVVCPDGFWRKGNVDIVCKRFNIPLYNSFDDYKKKGINCRNHEQ